MSKRAQQMSTENHDSDKQTLVVMAVFDNIPLHVTLAFRDNCSADDASALCDAVRDQISLPIQFELGRHIWVGKQRELEAVAVSPVRTVDSDWLQIFWRTHNRRSDAAEQCYTYNLHITLKNDEKRRAVQTLEKQGHCVTCNKVVVRRLGDKKNLFAKKV